MDLSSELRRGRALAVVIGFAVFALGFLAGVLVTRWIG